MENNIVNIFFAIAPILLYSFFIYLLVPIGYISIKRAIRYLILGMLAPTIVFMLNYVFPALETPINSSNPIVVYGFQSFFQIALIEEFAKFLTFWWLFSQRKNKEYTPISILYYAMMASAGFALVENFNYLKVFGNEVLFIRAISAIVLHLLCGIFLGFYIQKAFSVKKVLIEKESFYERFKPDLHKWKFILTGIAVATIFHGIYDLNLFLPFNTYNSLFLFIILIFGLFISVFMIKEVITKSLEIRNKF